MRIADLSNESLERIRSLRYDRIIEKHEGPEWWASALKWHDPEFLQVCGHDVLLPVPREQHPRITVLRCIESRDGNVLTIFLKNTTFVENREMQRWDAGFVAVCERLDGEAFFIATLYHEWYVLPEFGPVTPEERQQLFREPD